MTLLDCLRDSLALTGAHAGCEHGVCGACTVLLDGVAVRSCLMFAVQADGYAITTIEGLAPGPGELSLLQDAFCETHGMQCGYCTPAMILAAHALLAGNPAPTRDDIVEAISGNICRCTGYAQIVEAIALAAERMRGANQPAACAMSAPGKIPLRLVRPPRARGPPLRGRQGPLRRRHRAAGHAPRGAGDLAASGRAHRRDRQDRGARDAGRALRARRPRACRRDAAADGRPRHAERAAPAARGRHRALCRRMGRGRGGRHARAAPRTRPRRCAVEYEPLPFVLDGEEAYAPGSPPVHAEHGSNVLLDRTFVWGEVERDFAESPHRLALRVKWGRSSTVPVETFGGARELGSVARDPRRLGLDPDAEISRPDRRRAQAADVVGARAPRRRRRRQLRRQARHQAHRAGRLSVAPARLPGAADRGSPGEHARRRRARAGAAVRRRGRVRR